MPPQPSAGGDSATRQPLYVFSGGFLTQARIRRILTLAGYDIRIGKPSGPGDRIGVWGRSPTAPRGETVSDWTDAPVVRIEDAFLRSVRPRRVGGDGPVGLLIDPVGVHFDSGAPSKLEGILSGDPLDDGAVLERARVAMARMKASHLSKYNDFDPELDVPAPGYVLVIDQTRGDASVLYGGATDATFREMLAYAEIEHPGQRIIIKTHPETAAGAKHGYYDKRNETDRIRLLADPVSPWALLDGAVAVYTVSSQLGFEAILAGHRPRVFGQPFYSGWGLTEDQNPVPRRTRRLTKAQLFAGAMILAPTWYDPCRDRLCDFEEAAAQIEAEARAWREDRRGHVAVGMRLWKRPYLQRVFGRHRRLVFSNDRDRAVARARAEGRDLMVWAGQETKNMRDQAAGQALRRVEDGFLRSRGLGADLIPPLSLVADRSGIYYDPTRESDLERLIAAGPPPGGEDRADRLMTRLIRAGLTKYAPEGGAIPELPPGRRILVPGQVEDDASIRLGAGRERTNHALLERVRAENHDAVIVYKPHPDVEAGLRPGGLSDDDALNWADLIARGADPARLLEAVDEVWTISSAMGFEALIRRKPVTCLGLPFYAGWGLTRDLTAAPARRTARPTLAALVHAALIAYPRYLDPLTGLPCPAEVIADRLAADDIPHPGRPNRILAKLQGLLASRSWLWR